MDNVDFTDADLVHHVKDALNKVSMGDTDKYNQLVAVMHLRATPAPDAIALLVHIPVCPFLQIQIVSLYAWETSLKALSGAVSHIDNDRHELLLKLIFCMSLWNYGPDVMDALLELIVLLAASNGKVVESCLEMLVNNFTPPYSFTNMLNQPRGIARKDQVLSRVHSALEDIADLVPLVPMKLLPIVIKRKPHYNSQEQVSSGCLDFLKPGIVCGKWFSVYVENMLRLEGGAFGTLVRSTMLSGVVDLLLDLDGNIKMELEDAAETTDDESDRTEFVMFYSCALDPEHCRTRFATMLTDILVYNVYPLLRMSAVAYLASYLSRGKFLSTSLVINMLKRLVDWCFEYWKMQNGGTDPKALRIFYSGCQAIMYVLCFCMRSLMTIPRFRSQLLSLPIGIILSHSLCPLK
ncbi:RNA polymerase I specific transcription initiation factor [Parasponia andersonii]|uniref:RNA polymerase I specific transcription initiation factor n=1 Tax=Parasponia andersonii TaxID=3476 RepID=A0A2P5E3K5_PARAD|nr:RNA polymerase I specific transcription initiation factor [Parasponia andersonii]